MKKISTLLLCLCVVGCAFLHAQVPKDIAEKLSPSILVRVHDVVSKVPLSAERIQALADHFQKEEKLLAGAILKNASEEDLMLIQAKMKSEFRDILTQMEQNEYYKKKAGQYSEDKARITAAYLRSKYQGDSVMENYIRKSLASNDRALDKTMLHYNQTNELDKWYTMVLSKTDSIEDRLKRKYGSLSYIQKKIAMLDSIQPLGQEQRKSLKGYFIAKAASTDDSFRSIFDDAMRSFVKEPVYYSSVYKDEIIQKSKDNTKNYLVSFGKPVQVLKDMAPLYQEYQEKLLAVDYAIPGFSTRKHELTSGIDSKYKSLLDSAKMRHGILFCDSRISAAIHFAKALELRSGQVDSLLAAGDDLVEKQTEFLTSNPSKSFQYLSFERKKLVRILSAEQHKKLLTLFFTDDAKKWSDLKWEEIEKFNLAASSNVTKVKANLFRFHLNRLIAFEQNADDIVLRNTSVKNIENEMPAVLRKLATVQSSFSREQELKNAFTW